MFVYWFFCVVSILAQVACVIASVSMVKGFREHRHQTPHREALLSLSMIVPIKGVHEAMEAHLDALVVSELQATVEYLFAIEASDDPALEICQAVMKRHPEKDIHLVLTGPAQGRMGKQHNLAVAVEQARYEAIGSMDADVLVEPDTLARGLRYLGVTGTGVAYFLPCYKDPRPSGGLLIALYNNYSYQLYMGALALTINAPFITGALWLMSKVTVQTLGGLGQFGLTVSDDAAIGRAIVKHHLRNVLVPCTVTLPCEHLSLVGGAKQLLKWLALLRAEGLLTYLSIVLMWHPLFWSGITLISGVLLFGLQSFALLIGVILFITALATRWSSAIVLNRRVYSLAGTTGLAWLVIYELVAVPLLFLKGVFQQQIAWRGRRYRLGRHGRIKHVTDL